MLKADVTVLFYFVVLQDLCINQDIINILCTALFQVHIKCYHTIIFKVFEINICVFVIDASLCFVLTES